VVCTSTTTRTARRILFELGPLISVMLLLCCKLLYLGALLPEQWQFPMNDWNWWNGDQGPVAGWIRPPDAISGAIQARPLILSATLASLVVLFGPLFMVPLVYRLPALLVVDLTFTLLAVADIVHYRFFGEILSVSDLYVLRQVRTIVPSVASRLHPVDGLYFLEVVAGLVLLPLYVRSCRHLPGLTRSARMSLSVGLLASALLLAIPIAQLTWQEDGAALAPTSLRYDIARTIGILPYHLYDLALYLRPGGRVVGHEDLDRIRHYLGERREHERPPAESFGVARGRNVILLSAESLQAFPLGLEIGGQAVMPRLTAFAAESLYFSNFHDQTHLGVTSDAEFMALNSLHPLPARALASKFPDHHYRALPTILTEHGYSTMSAVASRRAIWGMFRLHPRYGFQQSFFEESYDIREHFGQWASDREYFAQTIPLLVAQPEPFVAFLLSSANHHPYDVPEHHRVLQLGALEGTLLGNYLQSVHTFDVAFGEFIDALGEHGLLDTSVIVIYGDHHGFLDDPPELARLLGVSEPSELDRFKVRKQVPFIIRLPHGHEAGVGDVAAGHLDIAPTILGLLGIVDERRVMLGRDLLRGDPPLVVFRDGSFTDGTHYFINRPGPISASSCYEARIGRRVDCTPLAERRRAAHQRLELSDLIIEGDLIPALAGQRGT